MLCSIRFIELTLQLGTEDFERHLDRRLHKSEEMYQTDFGWVDEAHVKRGVGVAFYDSPKKKKIKLIVYCPGLVIDPNDPDELWEPTHGNVSKLVDKLDKMIVKYLSSDYGLHDFDLARVDIAADLNVGRERVADYIKVLHNIRQVKCFSPMKYGRRDGKTKQKCFGLIGNSNNVDFFVHGLEYDKKTLRAEVRLMKNSTIRDYTDETDTAEQLRVLAEKREAIFMDTFQHIVPRGDFYKKPKAEKLVRERVTDWKLRSRMLRLLTLIPEKKSLHLALKAMSYRKLREVLIAFAEIDVSPVTISKRHDRKELPSLYRYMD